jgi:flagellin
MGYLDKAQQLANAQRSKLGAAMNRIQYTVNNLLNIVQNTQEAKSRIFDTDYAAESAALAKAKVLAEAGTAMLAQANQAPQLVLQLLK